MRRLVVFFTIVLLIIAVAVAFSGYNPLELKLKAGLQVKTGEVTASLFLDDQYLDKTPFINKQIQPGDYLLRIEPDSTSLVPYELPIKLNKGMVTVVTWDPGATLETSGGSIYEMEKLPRGNDAQIDLQTVPDGAIITFDGGSKQFSPLLLTDLAEGSHQFEISLPSYKTQQHSINLIKGHQVIVTTILARTGEIPPIGEITELNDQQPAATEALEELTVTQGPQVQILSTNFFVNDKEVLRVRDEPSPAGAELGFAPVGESYAYLGEQTDWFQLEFEGQPGWVSAQYSQAINIESGQTNQ